MEPSGTVVFSTVGRPNYGFDIFSVSLTSHHGNPSDSSFSENRLTDGVAVNFNAQFVDDEQAIVYVSDRTGSNRIYLNRPGGTTKPQIPHPAVLLPHSLFLDRPVFKIRRLYFISAHEQPDLQFKSWSALYSVDVGEKEIITRLTPYGCADFSPSLSQSGNSVAVASYGSRAWPGEFHDLQTDIVVFPVADPTRRVIVCEHGGWPTWCGDDTIYFHRQADDGWWSIFRLDLDLPQGGSLQQQQQQFTAPRRVTPPGLHCFTPAAMHGCRTQIAVATRRKGNKCRHVEIFDLELQKFYPVTELLNPDIHHYNPFVSPDSGFLGYHRFRGESAATGDMIVPYLEPVSSPCRNLRMLRLHGTFPSFSPDGNLIVFNTDFDISNCGIRLVRADGSKRWNLLEDRIAFYTSWSRADKNVIFTSIGPVFDTVKANVQVARVTFDPDDLGRDGANDIPAEVKLLTREETGNNAFPSCSPDGKYLVFRSGRSGYKNLYIVDAVEGEFSGGIRRLTEGQWIDTMPSWSPAGNLIAFSSNRHNPKNVDAFGVYVVRPDGTDLRRIYVAGPEGSEEASRERINHVCFSGDGEWLLFTANLGGVTAEPVSLPNHFQPYGDLYVVRLDGSGLRRLTLNGYENGTPAWHPAGSDELGSELGRRLSLESKAGDKLKGEFDEPLWIKCDM